MLRFCISAIFILLSLYVTTLTALYFGQRRFIYVPPTHYFTPSEMGLFGFKVITDESGAMLGWWHPPAERSKASVIYFHGNGSAIYSNERIYRRLTQDGYGVFALAYPGYPGRDDKASQDAITAAAISAFDFLISQNIALEKIALYGTSLGGGIAAQLSGHRPPALLIIESSFVSMVDIAQEKFPLFPVKWLVKDDYHSAKALGGSDIPLLWIHGHKDRIIPYAHGRILYENYGGPKQSLELEDAHHTNSWDVGAEFYILARLSQL